MVCKKTPSWFHCCISKHNKVAERLNSGGGLDLKIGVDHKGDAEMLIRDLDGTVIAKVTSLTVECHGDCCICASDLNEQHRWSLV